jgi:hypothetical protein
MTRIAATLLLVVIMGWASMGQAAPSREHYMSPAGDDAASGTVDHPWRTLAHAVEQLAPGDTLYLRGGTYLEHDLTIRLKGSAAAPITIQSYPGERAVVEGGLPDFRAAPNAAWEVVDRRIQLYRSVRTIVGTRVRAWLIDDDRQLVEYDSAANLEATNYDVVDGFKPFYMGPGVQLRDDGHVYIRLQYNPNDLTDVSGRSIAPTPRDADPNHNRIAIFTAEYLIALDEVEYLHFKDIDFAYAINIIKASNRSHHIELSGCHIRYSKYGIIVRDGVNDWAIHDNEFTNGLPDYVYWTDVKNKETEVAEAYPEFQSDAINGSISGSTIQHNLFRDAFDALRMADGAAGVRITENTFVYIRDDAINLRKGIDDVEIAHNLLWHVGSGIANLGSDREAGSVYIHHNIIDNTAYQHGGRAGNYRANNWPVWTTIDPFGSHDQENKASWWRLYNNTIITRRSGYPRGAAGPTTVTGSTQKYVYNNIFYVLDDRVIYRDDLAAAGSHYDGNVIYRRAPGRTPLFINFGNGRDYASLADFRKQSGTDWEDNGLELDPGFPRSAIDDPTFDADTIWERYRPHNAAVFTAGASYRGLTWPETEGVNYRGAIPPTYLQVAIFTIQWPTIPLVVLLFVLLLVLLLGRHSRLFRAVRRPL